MNFSSFCSFISFVFNNSFFLSIKTEKLLDMYYKFIDGSTKKILIDRGNQTTLGKIYAQDMVP